MRMTVLVALLFVAGCASDPGGELTGRYAKNGAHPVVERLGTVTTTSAPGELQCGSRQLMWCTGDRSGETCRCVYKHVAEERVRAIADRLKTDRFRTPRR